MQLLDAFALIITLTALFAYFNEKFLKLPATIGVTLVGLVASLFLLAVNAMGANLVPTAQKVLEQIDFGTFLMEGVLSFLLFAGALNVNAEVLRKYKTPVLVMAVFSTLISTFLIGGLTSWILGLFGMQIPLIYALLFGALISPTDPLRCWIWSSGQKSLRNLRA